jgi:hypothetical protein
MGESFVEVVVVGGGGVVRQALRAQGCASDVRQHTVVTSVFLSMSVCMHARGGALSMAVGRVGVLVGRGWDKGSQDGKRLGGCQVPNAPSKAMLTHQSSAAELHASAPA